MEFNVRMNVGCFDFCHPNKRETNISICYPGKDKPLNLCADEDFYEQFCDEPWDIIVEASCDQYIKHTLWSSDLESVKLLRKNLDEMRDNFWLSWSDQEEKRLKDIIKRSRDELENIVSIKKDILLKKQRK